MSIPILERRKSDRIVTLDGLRGCAVLMILMGHDLGFSPVLRAPPGTFRSYVRFSLGLANTGVDLFFVLSGFLIGGILLDHLDSGRMLKAFYVRRFLRIVPVAWVCIMISMMLHHGSWDRLPANIPWWVAFTFTTNFFLAAANGWILGPLTAQWSLGIEEQFYLFFPWLVRAWPRRSLMWLGPALIGGALIARVMLNAVAPRFHFAWSMLTFCRLDSLGAGFTIACLVRSAAWERFRGRRRLLWGALIFFGLFMAILLKCQYRAPLQMATWGYTAVGLFYGVVLLIAYDPPERLVRTFLSSSLLRFYGRLSYFIYVFQAMLTGPLVWLVFRGKWASSPVMDWPKSVSGIVLILAPAVLSWYLFEAPLLRFSKRWRY